jgi:hypothetical protein
MQKATPSRQLPVVLPPAADEIPSSWISRHAAFYGVPPITMLQHCLPQATSLRAIDLHLTRKQAELLADVFGTKPDVVHGMGFTTVSQISHRLIAPKPIQSCPKCTHDANDTMAVTRTQVLGWRLCCSSCGSPLQGRDAREHPSPFCSYWSAALRGEELLDAEAESGIHPWASPIDIARLLLMRRNPKTVRPEMRNSSQRILGVILPELEAVVANSWTSLPSPANLILPLNLRPALLAGIAIVERAGPAILEMLHAHTLGENRAHFGKLADHMLAQNRTSADPQQLQLI